MITGDPTMAETHAAANQSTTRPAAAPPPKPARRSLRSFFWGSLIGALILIPALSHFLLRTPSQARGFGR